MRKLILFSVLMIVSMYGLAQADTLYTVSGKKIPCKIYEINELEMRYRLASNPDGPVFVIDKTTIRKYVLASGYTEVIMHDELSLDNEHKEILGNREVIKIHPFGLAFNHVSLAYEKVIKVGMNLDAEVGYINSSISQYQMLTPNDYGNPFTTGVYIKPGLKFFLGQDFSVKGLKYAHPLKGRYIKIDLAFAYLNFQDVNYTIYSYSGILSMSPTYTVISSNINALGFGGFVNYGRQFILGNLFTLDYYIGIGFTGQSISYSNPAFATSNGYLASHSGYRDFSQSISNYYGFGRIPGFGLSGTCGFRIGYILPSKQSRMERKAEHIKNRNGGY